MPNIKKNNPTTYKLTCLHEYIKNEGIITCSKCDLKAISYLTPINKYLSVCDK